MPFEGWGAGMEIQRRRGLPGGRAVLGGVLMAVATVGVFVAFQQADRPPADAIVVATHSIHAGEVMEADDLEVLRGDLPARVSSTFARVEDVVGRVALGPIRDGDVVQSTSVTDDVSELGLHEVAITLPRRELAVGRLKEGERVDVFVTYDERTTSVVRGASVVQIGVEENGSLTSDREIAVVVAVPNGDAVAALVHALRTGDVTVVRSTFAETSADGPISFEGGSPSTMVDDQASP